MPSDIPPRYILGERERCDDCLADIEPGHGAHYAGRLLCDYCLDYERRDSRRDSVREGDMGEERPICELDWIRLRP